MLPRLLKYFCLRSSIQESKDIEEAEAAGPVVGSMGLHQCTTSEVVRILYASEKYTREGLLIRAKRLWSSVQGNRRIG
jgi:hypothetical protein